MVLDAVAEERPELKAGRKVVGYGASARSSTLLNYCGITGDRISVIADQNDFASTALKDHYVSFTSSLNCPISMQQCKCDCILLLTDLKIQ